MTQPVFLLPLNPGAKALLQGTNENIIQRQLGEAISNTEQIFDSYTSLEILYRDLRYEYAKVHGEDEAKILDKAFEFSKKGYNGLTRVDGPKPYLFHPLEIAYNLFVIAGIHDKAAVKAALFHDLVEDTKITLDEIKQKFGEDVAIIVNDLTEKKEYLNNAHLTYTASDGKTYNDSFAMKLEHLDRVEKSNNRLSIIIKVLDRYNNLRTDWSPKSPKVWTMRVPEVQRWFKFIENPLIPKDLRSDILPFLECELQKAENYKALRALDETQQ